jgi:iron(III) transport system substrate-binding protein
MNAGVFLQLILDNDVQFIKDSSVLEQGGDHVKKFLSVIFVLAVTLFLSACSNISKPKVVIYSSAEDYRNDHFRTRLHQQFPEYDIVLEYVTTGNHAAKLKAEGTKTECDISLDLEYGYFHSLKHIFADLSEYDASVFLDDLVRSTHYFPEGRNSGAIIINTNMLAERDIAVPSSYEDLLRPEYKGLISMPSPKSSGTGYMFLKNLVNVWGEEQAFAYFADLSENVLQYTSSGSGPVNALVQGEVAIGLGMTAQATTVINNGAKLDITFFEEGAPYSLYGIGIIKGKESREEVKNVFRFFHEVLIPEDKELFYPEPIYKEIDYEIPNYPSNIPYADMSNDTFEEKERLLSKWTY